MTTAISPNRSIEKLLPPFGRHKDLLVGMIVRQKTRDGTDCEVREREREREQPKAAGKGGLRRSYCLLFC